MYCVDTNRYLYDFMDKELDTSLYAIMKKHIENCDACNQRYEFEMSTRSLLKSHCKNVKAPSTLYKKIAEGLDTVDMGRTTHITAKRKTSRIFFSPLSYSVAASLLLFLAAGIYYYMAHYHYNEASFSIVDSAVQNHIRAVNSNLIINERPSLVRNSNSYLKNISNTIALPPRLTTDRTSTVREIPVNFCGTKSSCFVFDHNNRKLTLQKVRNNRFSTKRLKRAHLGHRDFYLGNYQGFNTVIWENNGITYCLTSDINTLELLNIATTFSARQY